MMIRCFLTYLISCFLSSMALSQYDANHLPDSYQSKENPYYWKNKLPKDGYWQQDVAYTITAYMDDSLDIISGDYQLTYTNNSSDTLSVLYFHLYQNAFTPHSHMHDVYENNGKEIEFGTHEKNDLGTTIKNLTVNGLKADTSIHNTLLKVSPTSPILPYSNTVISLNFKTYFDGGGSFRRRMKTYNSSPNNKHFDGVHWYPSVCVYDRKFGWTTEQHLDKEFYHNFGSFDVTLDFPGDYIIGATGTLQNEKTVYPDSLRQQLDLSNFYTDQSNKQLNRLTDRKNERVKWHFYCENVHSFAFTADPMYRIAETKWNGITIQTLAQQQNALGWSQSGEFTKKVIQTYSEDIGMYAWPKIIIADANDGMEYPMLTLDRGKFPNHEGLLAHEVGHMWFYGMIGSNETYRAFLDEGFTQFLTVWSLEHINGKEKNYKEYKAKGKGASLNHTLNHLYPKRSRYESLYYPYIKTVRDGYDYPLNTHSSMFNGAVRHGGGYGLVYYKTGVMLYNLQYVLGDQLFKEALQFYFKRWQMAHPYPEDFRQAIMDYTKADLNWFFDQWLETTKNIDYSIKSVHYENDKAKIKLARKGLMQMPIDLMVTYKDGTKENYYIPNTFFKKQTDAITLPMWYGWDRLHPSYSFEINTNKKIASIKIDPTNRLADINLSNNIWTSKVNLPEYDHLIKNYAWWYKKENFWRPDLWYNRYDGMQIGLLAKGNYFKNTWNYEVNIMANTRLFQFGVEDSLQSKNQPLQLSIKLQQQLFKLGKRLYLEENFYWGTGLYKAGLGFNKIFRNQDSRQKNYSKMSVLFNAMYRESNLNYTFYPEEWSKQKLNNFIDLKYKRHYTYKKGSGDIQLGMRTPNLGSDFNYSYLDFESINNNKLGKLNLKTRVYGRFGLGNTPGESALFAASANQEEMLQNKITTAPGFFPTSWEGYGDEINHFQAGGGLNLRGYAGYLLPQGDGSAYKGNSGAAFNMELEFQNLLDRRPKKSNNIRLQTYFFGDIGVMNYENLNNKNQFSDPLIDAGIGSAVTFKTKYYDIKPFTVRFDMPFFVYAPNIEAIDWRFVLGINRAF